MRLMNRSPRPTSRLDDFATRYGPDWGAIGSSMRSMWNRNAPDVARDPGKLRKFADKRIARPISDLPNTASTAAPAITGAVLAALPQALDALAGALRNLPDNVTNFAESIPDPIEAVRRRRQPPFWRRPATIALGLGILGTLLVAWWAATSTAAVDTIRHSVRQARRRLTNGTPDDGTSVPIDRMVTGYSSDGSGYADADVARPPSNGLPAASKRLPVAPSGDATVLGTTLPDDAARGMTDSVADVETANTESWVPVGPESAVTRPEITERSIRG